MQTSTHTPDEDLIGAELVSGATSIGHVLDVRRDPISHRVWWLITAYGPHGRKVAVPIEWVVRRTPTRVTLAVGPREFGDLPDEPGPIFTRAGSSRMTGAAVSTDGAHN